MGYQLGDLWIQSKFDSNNSRIKKSLIQLHHHQEQVITMELAKEKILSIRQEGTVREYSDEFQFLFDQVKNCGEFCEYYVIYLFMNGLKPDLRDVFIQWHQYSLHTLHDTISLALKLDSNELKDSFSPYDPKSSLYDAFKVFEIKDSGDDGMAMENDVLNENGKEDKAAFRVFDEMSVESENELVVQSEVKEIEDDIKDFTNAFPTKIAEIKNGNEIPEQINGDDSITNEDDSSWFEKEDLIQEPTNKCGNGGVIQELIGRASIADNWFANFRKEKENNQVHVEYFNDEQRKSFATNWPRIHKVNCETKEWVIQQFWKALKYAIQDSKSTCIDTGWNGDEEICKYIKRYVELHLNGVLQFSLSAWLNIVQEQNRCMPLQWLLKDIVQEQPAWLSTEKQMHVFTMVIKRFKWFRVEMNKFDLILVETFEWKPGWKCYLGKQLERFQHDRHAYHVKLSIKMTNFEAARPPTLVTLVPTTLQHNPNKISIVDMLEIDDIVAAESVKVYNVNIINQSSTWTWHTNLLWFFDHCLSVVNRWHNNAVIDNFEWKPGWQKAITVNLVTYLMNFDREIQWVLLLSDSQQDMNFKIDMEIIDIFTIMKMKSYRPMGYI